jgi:integration host factor subunit beta
MILSAVRLVCYCDSPGAETACVRFGFPEFMGELTAMNDTTMTKADLVEEVIRATELPRKESEAIVETIFDSIIQALQTGDKIEIRGFGSFRTRQRRGRIGRNPKTGAGLSLDALAVPQYRQWREGRPLHFLRRRRGAR